MINLLYIILFLLSNYIAIVYGIRLGKAMQKDIPPVPIEPVTNAVKRAYKAIKSKTHKSYLQKKAEKKPPESIWD
ncbi:MAG: hypothetical protein ABFD25_03220 [Clostridiaceae bacterium]